MLRRSLLLLAALPLLGLPASAADPGKIVVETVAYQGWQRNLRLSNGAAELIVTLDVGPRIISYRLADGKNVFKEYPNQLGKSGEIDWVMRGGHRLAVAPEDPTRTYVPDNSPVTHKVLNEQLGLVRLICPKDEKNGLQKELDIQLAATGSRVTVVHRITNIGKGSAELAPWGVTVMAPGGVEIIPLPPKRSLPKTPSAAQSAADFAPNQSIVLWPYFYAFAVDPRMNFGFKYFTVRHNPKGKATKVGMAHRMGWVGYLNEGTLFVKRFDYQEDKNYPDKGCNLESFTDEDMLDIESLGPLVNLSPGATVEHTEVWDLVGDVGSYVHQAEIDKAVLSKIPPK